MSYTSLELFFFGFARCRARNFFRSRATFANFRRCKFSCTGLETFAVGLRRVAHDTFFRSRAKQTLVYVEPLGELSRVASCQFWFRKFRARLLTFLCARCRARNIFGSRATFCKLCKVAHFRAQVWKLFLCARCRTRNIFHLACNRLQSCTFSCTSFETFFVCKMSCTRHFRLACNFLQTLQSCTFSCTSLETFFVCKMSCTKHFRLTCNFLQTLQSSDFRARVWKLFLCARCRARNIFGSRARQTFVHAEPLGELSRVAKFLILVPKFRVHFFENFFLVCEMSRTKHFSARVQLFCKITKFIFSCMNFFFVLQTCRKGYIFSARVHKLSGSY